VHNIIHVNVQPSESIFVKEPQIFLFPAAVVILPCYVYWHCRCIWYCSNFTWHSVQDRRDDIPVVFYLGFSGDKLCTGHTRVTQRYLLTGNSQPLCDECKCSLAVKHILLECYNLQNIWEKYFMCSSLKELFESWCNNNHWSYQKKPILPSCIVLFVLMIKAASAMLLTTSFFVCIRLASNLLGSVSSGVSPCWHRNLRWNIRYVCDCHTSEWHDR